MVGSKVEHRKYVLVVIYLRTLKNQVTLREDEIKVKQAELESAKIALESAKILEEKASVLRESEVCPEAREANQTVSICETHPML